MSFRESDGKAEGVVVDDREVAPVSDADIFVIEDPWPELSDGEIVKKSYASSETRIWSVPATHPSGWRDRSNLAHQKRCGR